MRKDSHKATRPPVRCSLASPASPDAVHLKDEDILRAWSAQAPRGSWLKHPGDSVLIRHR